MFRPTEVGLSEYLASLSRIERVLSQMTSTSLRANQEALGDFNELLYTGSIQLQNLFRSILTSHAQMVEPLHFITKRKVTISVFSSILMTDRDSLSDHA